MCLLVKQPASTAFTKDFIEDVYRKNSDGFGVMYAEDGKLHVYKCLPASAEDMYNFYATHAEGRDCIWHARMQTHGDIDLDNCHPYKVTDSIYMAHNGVLASGNDADRTKSDTGHFIKNIIRPALQADPDLLLDENWIDFIGGLIGRSNKFGFVRADGVMAVVNEDAGVEFVGAWLSNTYAWSTTKFGFRSAYQGQSGYTDSQTSRFGNQGSLLSSPYSRGSWYENQYEYDDYQGYHQGYGKVGSTYEAKGAWEEEVEDCADSCSLPALTDEQVKPMVRAAFNQWSRKGLVGVKQWVKDAPYKAACLLAHWYGTEHDLPEDRNWLEDLVMSDPDEASEWICDLFDTDSVKPSLIQ